MGPSTARSRADLIRFMGAHHGSFDAKESMHSNWRTYLQGLTSSSSKNVCELELLWLAGVGATTGTLADRWAAYTKSLGYAGDARERQRTYWASW